MIPYIFIGRNVVQHLENFLKIILCLDLISFMLQIFSSNSKLKLCMRHVLSFTFTSVEHDIYGDTKKLNDRSTIISKFVIKNTIQNILVIVIKIIHVRF